MIGRPRPEIVGHLPSRMHGRPRPPAGGAPPPEDAKRSGRWNRPQRMLGWVIWPVRRWLLVRKRCVAIEIRLLSCLTWPARRWWLRRQVPPPAALDGLSGVAFERAMSTLFRASGYDVRHTPASGDMGLDLVVSDRRRNVRIGVQLKRWGAAASVGVSAVQEAYAGARFYDCDVAAVFTTARLSRQALLLAAKLGVACCDRDQIRSYVARRNVPSGALLPPPPAPTPRQVAANARVHALFAGWRWLAFTRSKV